MWISEKLEKQADQLKYRLSKRNSILAAIILENLDGEITSMKSRLAKIAADELIRNQITWISICFTSDAYDGNQMKFPLMGEYHMLSLLSDPEQSVYADDQTDKEILFRNDINWNIPLVYEVLRRHGLKPLS